MFMTKNIRQKKEYITLNDASVSIWPSVTNQAKKYKSQSEKHGWIT